MIPGINVNMTFCALCRDCDHAPEQAARCPGAPVLVPCPIGRAHGPMKIQHPTLGDVEVMLTISGDTWETSAISEVVLVWRDGARHAEEEGWPTQRDCDAAHDIGVHFWNVVKNYLTLPAPSFSSSPILAPIAALYVQRDAVFAALVDMSRAEDAAREAQARCDAAAPFPIVAPGASHNLSPERRPSATRLASFVSYLLEQVQVLP